MTTDNLQEMLDKIDSITQLIDDADVVGQFQETKKNIAVVEENSLQLLEEAKREVTELETELEALTIKEKALKKVYDEKVERITEYKGEMARYDIEIEQDEQTCKELEAEIEDIERQITDLDKPSEGMGPVDEGLLQMAIYDGLGIHFSTDNNKQHTKANLTTANREDIITLALEDVEPAYTAEYIWNFISNAK